ncbi:MAG: type II secretion system F family protein [Bacilli bacterium]|nr:type II secretion system F family protein [Bacilli bacterium]
MKKFKYVATDKDGKTIKGSFVAENEAEMKEMLLKAGYFVTSFRQVSTSDLSAFFSLSGKVKVNELSQFCNQFSIMIAAGISIEESIEVASQQSFSRLLKTTLSKVLEDLRQGVLLSDAMAKHPKVFPPFFSSMVFVGESAGCLDRVLVNVAEYYQLEERTKKKVRGALAYPIILLVMLIGVVVVMMAFVIPQFVGAFAKMDIEMPALTMAIFNMSNFFKENILFILAFLFAFIVIMWALHFLPSVKELSDKLKIKLPIFHRINLAIFTSRFCRSLGLLLASGSDSLSALENLKKTITNRYLAKQFDKVVTNVQMGMSLSSALSSEMSLSPVLIQMIIVGERTGDLAPILNRTAPYFDAQAEASLNLITTIVQPTIMLLLGASVAILFIAIYSPILQMITQLQV